MANETIVMHYVLRKNNSEHLPKAYGKYYAQPRLATTLNLRGLARHMVSHGVVRSRVKVETVLNKLEQCIPELLSQGIGIQLDGLGKFYPTVESVGADDAEKFNAATDIEGIHIRFAPVSSNEENLTSRAFKKRIVFQMAGVLRGTAKTARRIISAEEADREDDQNP